MASSSKDARKKAAQKTAAEPLSKKGILFLALLALQFGMQPILFREFSPRTLNKKSIVLVGEMTKFVLSSTMLVASGQAAEAFTGWSIIDAAMLAGLPALVYTVQNIAIQTAYVNMDGLTFNLLNQSKILFTAIVLYFWLGKPQSMPQCVALLGLFSASCILSNSSSSSSDDNQRETAFYEGVVPCLVASVLSGVASALSQRALQTKQRHSLVFTMELAFFSSVSVVVGEMVLGGATVESMAEGWTASAMIPVISNGLGGICVGMVIKYAGGVRKGFAIVGGIILTGLFQYHFYQTPLTNDILIALPIVITSVIVHILYPYVPPPDSSAVEKKDK